MCQLSCSIHSHAFANSFIAGPVLIRNDVFAPCFADIRTILDSVDFRDSVLMSSYYVKYDGYFDK